MHVPVHSSRRYAYAQGRWVGEVWARCGGGSASACTPEQMQDASGDDTDGNDPQQAEHCHQLGAHPCGKNLSVTTLQGKTFGVYVTNKETVAVVKDKIYKKEGIAAALPQLVHNGKLLDDDQKLPDDMAWQMLPKHSQK